MESLGEAFSADQEAQLAMTAAIFQLAVKLHVLVLAHALRLPVLGFDQDEAAQLAPEGIGARVAQHQINLFRRRVVVALADGETGNAGKDRCQQLLENFTPLACVALAQHFWVLDSDPQLQFCLLL